MEKSTIQKIFLKFGILIILATLILPTLRVLAADGDYAVLTPLPGVADNVGDTTTLEKYVPAIFNILVGLSAVAAVLMIVIGGFQYMSTDAIQGKSAGKERIKNAVFGLVLVISAWLILYTINPNLLTLNLNIDAVTTTAPTGGGFLSGPSGPGTAMTPAEIAASDSVRASLESKGILTYANACVNGGTTGCVNLNGLTQNTQNGLTTLKTGCGSGCFLIITGGTEAGHNAGSTHTDGVSVDVRLNSALNTYINNYKTGDPIQTSYGPVYTVNVNGKTTTFLNEGNHWHVTFK